jgi:hypothetical protein
MRVSLQKNFFCLLVVMLWTLGAAQAQPSGVFPPEPFNGLQIAYQIAGAQVTKAADVPGYTWTRSLTISGFDGSGQLAVSGKLNADWGFGAEVSVSVSAGGKSESKVYKIEPGKPQSFNVAVAVPRGATNGGVSIVMTGHYNVGMRGVVIKGAWDSHGVTNPVAEPDKDRGAMSPVWRMKEIMRLYAEAMPEGRAVTGVDNNFQSWTRDGYDQFKCGGYQGKGLSALDKLRLSNDPKLKSLLEGYEYGPIQGWAGGVPFGHQAIVIYPKNTDWKVTGTVLDPWPTQKHEGKPITYTTQQWSRMFPGIAPSDYYEGKYSWGTYPTVNDFKILNKEEHAWVISAPPAMQEKLRALRKIPDEAERTHAIRNLYQQHKHDTGAMVKSPLHAYLVDGQGRISGFPGGVPRTEIPDVLINTFQLEDGTFWTELNYPRDPSIRLMLEGTGAGQATVLSGFNMQAAPSERRIHRYQLQVAAIGQKFVLEQHEEGAPVKSSGSPAPAPVAAKTIFNIWNIEGVASGPTAPTIFHTPTALRLTYLNTYHYHHGRGAPAGTIGLRHSDGTVYGPWRATGVLSSGAPDGTWEVRPNVVLKPGSYTVLDSDPPSWSHNASSRGRGFVEVRGVAVPD